MENEPSHAWDIVRPQLRCVLAATRRAMDDSAEAHQRCSNLIINYCATGPAMSIKPVNYYIPGNHSFVKQPSSICAGMFGGQNVGNVK